MITERFHPCQVYKSQNHRCPASGNCESCDQRGSPTQLLLEQDFLVVAPIRWMFFAPEVSIKPQYPIAVQIWTLFQYILFPIVSYDAENIRIWIEVTSYNRTFEICSEIKSATELNGLLEGTDMQRNRASKLYEILPFVSIELKKG